MWGAGVSGFYQESKGKSKTNTNMWTGEQQKVAKGLGNFFQQWVDPTTGNLKPVAPYTGQLAGTYTPETMSRLFSGAQGYASGDMTAPGSQLFQHYQMYADPAEREKRVQETLETRRRLLAPLEEREDALLRSKMKSMGLTHSSDMLKAQADVIEYRKAEEDALALDMLGKYEALGYQASEDALKNIQGISQSQYQIVNAGLDAVFREFLRLQPEYNPIIEQMMTYLGLQGIESEKTKASGSSWGTSGGASYGSGQQ